MAFIGADNSCTCDGKLSYHEFLTMLPDSFREKATVTQLHATFKAMVDDRLLKERKVQDIANLHITMLEYFLCAFHHSLHSAGGGSAVDEMFAKYDKDGSGQLDEAEFYMSLDDMNFGALD